MKIQSVAQKMQEVTKTVIYTYRGSVDNYSDLPTKDLTLGDVYNIANADEAHNIDVGDNVAWTGTEWDNLSGIANTSAIPSDDKIKNYISTHDTSSSAHADIRKLIPATYAASAVVNGDAVAAKAARTIETTDLNQLADAVVFISSSTAGSAANLPDGVTAPWFGMHMGCGSGKIQVIYAKDGMYTRYGTVSSSSVTWSEWLHPINAQGSIVSAETSENLNTLKRNTAYSVGDVAYNTPLLPSWARLVCTVAGTTASTEPTITSTDEGDTFTDGTVTWTISDVKHAFYVGS